MKLLKFKLNGKGVAQLMKSEEMKAVLSEKASVILERCGDGYEQEPFTGRNRATVRVKAATPRARNSNLKNNTILKAVQQ